MFAIFWLAVAAWAAHFIKEYGVLYVNWPKLNVPAFAAEGYADALAKARQEKVVGTFISAGGVQARQVEHERGASVGTGNIRLMHLEEGKKRIE